MLDQFSRTELLLGREGVERLAASALYWPRVRWVARIWRFRFVRLTRSLSIRSRAPTPLRTKASAA